MTVFKMTQMSMTMLEGIVVNWLKQEGDEVRQDEPLLEVETDKVLMEMTSPVTGIVKKHLAKKGDAVPVGGDLCIIADEAEDISMDSGDALAPQMGQEYQKVTAVASDAAEGRTVKQKISPLAKRVAEEEGIDLAGLIGTGPGGLIVKADVLNRRRQKTQIPAAVAIGEQDEVIALSGIRRVTAERMMISKTSTAAVTTFAEVDMSRVADMRKVLPVSYTSFAVRASALALREFPAMNSSIVENNIVIKKEIHINVAVATENSLVTPVLRDVGGKNLLCIAEEIEELTARSRQNNLTLQNLEGGTFTVSNSGVFGSLMFTPIINYPQCAILGTGKILKTPVVRGNTITIAPMMILCLTYDHRIVDGMTAVMFLQKIKHYLENPDEMVKRNKGEAINERN